MAGFGEEKSFMDKPKERVSIKEKLAQMREKVSGQKMPGMENGRGREESL